MKSVDELEKDLKQGKLNSLYFLYGEEMFLLETSLKKIKTNFGEIKEGINYIKLDEKNIDSLISDIETPAFGYDKKLIIVRNSGLFKKQDKKNKSSQATEQIEKITEYIENNISIINESVVLVFVEEADVEKNDLYKVIEKQGIVCNFTQLQLNDLIRRIKMICNGYKVNIDEPTIRYFITCCRNEYARFN